MAELSYSRIHLNPARCGADLSDGSERSLYVPMSHVFQAAGRPHHAINVMFTYYPFDAGWPQRASAVASLKPGMNQWDLPYDDYDVYLGGPGRSPDAEVFKQFRDIRRYGQDIDFTLTIDLNVPEISLRQIARDLVPFGRVFFRINHECNGVWFQHNKRFSYGQVSDFFVKFHTILKEEAPLVQTVLCINGFETAEQLHLGEDELAGAVRAADILAIDRYLSLHFGWPNEYSKDPATYFDSSVEVWWEMVLMNHRCLCETRGSDDCPVTLPELNADADVNGFAGQADRISALYDLIRSEQKPWLRAVTMYQFRDRGGLGLELEDPKTHKFVKSLPSKSAYRKAIADPFYLPQFRSSGVLHESDFPTVLRWNNADDAEGLCIEGVRPHSSRKMSLHIVRGNYLVECNSTWFHHEGDAQLDLASAAKPDDPFAIRIFAPPIDGTNSRSGDGSYLPYYLSEPIPAPEVGF